MTTIVRTRNPLETLSMSQPTARRRSKRIAETYDEEDDGFVFTRASKRSKTATTADSAPTNAPPPTSTAKRVRKPKDSKEPKPPRDEDDVAVAKKPRGRKLSFSTPKAEGDGVIVPKGRKSTRTSTENSDDAKPVEPSRAQPVEDSMSLVHGGSVLDANGTDVDPNKNATIITLPFSDTPVINRNKEMRKKGGNGQRRSSLGLRGRRASSLIDSGHSAIPHVEVETTEFYKHIEDGLVETRRMKQLFTWTAERCLGRNPEFGDPEKAIKHAAKLLTESLRSDFANKSEMSNWFDRETCTRVKVIKTPHPRNIELQEKVAGFEERLKFLRAERDEWKALKKPPAAFPPFLEDEDEEIQPSHIEASLLDPEQADILADLKLNTALDLRKQVTKRLQNIQSSLEFQVDQFADGVHKLDQYQNIVGRVADRILALSAMRLEERDRKEKEALGTRDLPIQEVLRSLSRILPVSSRR